MGRICLRVRLPGSSVYYHFKNKQAILDELLRHFESIATGFMTQLEQALTITQKTAEGKLLEQTCDCFFEKYLMDEYCNKVMRLLSLERFRNDEIQKIYDYWIFDKPLNFQTKVFSLLMSKGMLQTADSNYLAMKFYAPIYLFTQRQLFCGTLTDEQKQAFRGNAYEHIYNFFKEIEGL